jgi:hypothetical protein
MSNITNRLNSGLLPNGYFAMAEQFIGRRRPMSSPCKRASARNRQMEKP